MQALSQLSYSPKLPQLYKANQKNLGQSPEPR